MQLSHETTPEGLTRVRCAGKVDLVEFQHGRDPLVNLLGPQVYRGRVLFDLSQIEYIDSSGIGWLVVTFKRFCQAKGTIVFHSPSRFVRDTLDLLRLDLVLPLAEDEAAARAKVLVQDDSTN
jgi:anti-anti-sigma factor